MTDRKYVDLYTELDRAEVIPGVFITLNRNDYGYDDKPLNSYERLDLDGVEGTDIVQLAQLATILGALTEESYVGRDVDTIEEFLKEWASEVAEGAELPFTYTNVGGRTQTYSPASLWEASGSCSEWEQSAQYGYDYGWNI